MQIAEAYVSIRAQVDKTGFQRDITQQVGAAGTEAGTAAGKNLGTSMETQVRQSASNLGAILGALGAGLALRSAFTVEESAIESQAKLTLVLKSNGEQAGVTAAGLATLTKSIAENGAVTDESVKGAAALLLTFQDVRNEAGKNNDIFNRALTLSTDLSAFWGRDLNTTATQLGRALENPTAGMSALTRSGIAFSAQVKAQITDLAKQGDLVGAQALILDQVQQKVGGAAAAIAKADPFKQFSTSITEFKEQVGADLLPGVTAAVDVAKQLIAVFGAVPAPVRAGAEALILLGVAGAGISRVVGVLDGLKVSLIGSAAASGAAAAAAGTQAAAEAALAEAEATETAAATAAEEAHAALDGILATGAVDMGAYATATEAAAAADAALAEASTVTTAAVEGLASAEVTTAAASVGLGTAIGGIVAGLAAGVVGGNAINRVLGGTKPNVDDLAKSFVNLATSHALDANASSDLGDHLSKLSGDLKTIQGSTIEKGFGLAPSAHEAVKDISAVNEALNKVADTKGAKVAYDAFMQLRDALIANGTSIDTINRYFHPFQKHLIDIESQTAATGTGIDDLTTQIQQLNDSVFTKNTEKFGVEDAVANAQTALKDLDQARLDAIGKGDKSKAAADAEATAYQNLASAQDGVRTSVEGVAAAQQSAVDAARSLADAQNSLADAQQKLAEFDNPTSATIRSLKRENIVDRAVSTPEQVRQKEIDLLTNDQSNTDQRQSLVKSVATGQENVSKAVEGVSKAYESVGKAEEAVGKATQKVQDAQDKVAKAAEARKKIQVDAASAIAAAELKAEEAVNSVGTALANAKDIGDKAMLGFLNQLDLLSKALDPTGDLSKRLDAIILKQQALAQAQTPRQTVKNIGPYDSATYARLDAEAQPSFVGPISAKDQALLHKAGVPGFDMGGLAQWPVGEGRLAVVHGGEQVRTAGQQQSAKQITVEQHTHYHGTAKADPAETEWNNRVLGFLATRLGNEA